MESDAELLRRYVTDQSEAAFSTLVQRYLGLVYATALRELAGDSHRASDVAQLVFTQLARQAPALTSHPLLAGWLHRTTRHLALKSIRAEQRRAAREEKAHLMKAIHADENPADREELQKTIDWAIDRLDHRDKEAVLRRFFSGQSFEEIGRALALSEAAARMRVNRALEKLRTVLVRRGITSTTAALSAALTTYGAAPIPFELATTIATAASSIPVSGMLGSTLLFMSTAKTALVAVAVVALGSTLYQFNQTRRVEAELAVVTRGRDAMASQSKTKPERADQPAPAIRTAKSQGNEMPGRAVPAEPITLADMRELMSYPEYRKLQADVMRGQLDDRYAALFRKLKLSSAQLDQFKNGLVEKEQITVEAAQAAHDRGGTPIAKAVRDAQAPIDDQIHALLGEAGFRQYQDYEQTLPARAVINRLQQSLSYTESPLTDEQANQMMQMLQPAEPRSGAPHATIQIRYENGLVQSQLARGETWAGQVVVSEENLVSARTILSPGQMATFQNIKDQQQSQKILKQATLASVRSAR